MIPILVLPAVVFVATVAIEHSDGFRVAYALLAMLTAFDFTVSLFTRWSSLLRGEKIKRVGLILEHVVITYGAYVALKLDYPPTITVVLLTLALLVIVFGFLTRLVDVAQGRSATSAGT